MNLIEKAVTDCLADAILNKGFSITVNDGFEDPLKRSRDKDKVIEETGTTDETWWFMINIGGKRAGWWRLTHGNGLDVISDFSAKRS